MIERESEMRKEGKSKAAKTALFTRHWGGEECGSWLSLLPTMEERGA